MFSNAIGRARGLTLAVTVCASVLFAAGCREGYSERMLNPKTPMPAVSDDVMAGEHQAAAQQESANMTRLSMAPLAVRAAFSRDYPGAAVTSVEMRPTSTGMTLYRIGFISDRAAGQALYRPDGTDAVPTPQVYRPLFPDDEAYGRPHLAKEPVTTTEPENTVH